MTDAMNKTEREAKNQKKKPPQKKTKKYADDVVGESGD